MKILTTISAMRAAVKEARQQTLHSRRLGLVPTMGALHEGHLSLMRGACAACDCVAVSIFVNPTQFGPNEDLARYPRTFEQDCAALEAEGIDLLFAPSGEEMYPRGAAGTFVEVPGLSDRLDGRTRPGHFRGVATVVTKLLNIVAPDEVFFGQKDGAQVAVLQAMLRDLDFNIKLTVCPTVREPDGLAMSSRNRFLSPADRAQARTLSFALQATLEAASQGHSVTVETLRTAMLQSLKPIEPEYAELVDWPTLQPVTDLRHGALAVVAARVGGVRLIDNILLPPVFLEETEPQ